MKLDYDTAREACQAVNDAFEVLAGDSELRDLKESLKFGGLRTMHINNKRIDEIIDSDAFAKIFKIVRAYIEQREQELYSGFYAAMAEFLPLFTPEELRREAQRQDDARATGGKIND